MENASRGFQCKFFTRVINETGYGLIYNSKKPSEFACEWRVYIYLRLYFLVFLDFLRLDPPKVVGLLSSSSITGLRLCE